MSLWIVGTDTGVGKTLVSAVVLGRYARHSRLGYFKPVATGCEEERDRDCIEQWLGDSVELLDELYLLPRPLSPHLAARLAGVAIDPARVIVEVSRQMAAQPSRRLVIEGAGGVLVPLTDQGDLFIDVLAATLLPALVVARSTLGTINHTLLTLGALRSRCIPIAGVVLVGPINDENRSAIERIGETSVIGQIPPLGDHWPTTKAPTTQQIGVVAASFDRSGVLASSLT